MKIQSVLAAALVAFVFCSNLHSQTLQLKSTKAIDDKTAQIGGDPVEIDLSEFFEIVMICIPLHRSNLENSVKNRQQFCEIEY